MQITKWLVEEVLPNGQTYSIEYSDQAEANEAYMDLKATSENYVSIRAVHSKLLVE